MQLSRSPPMDRSDAQTAAVDFLTQASFLLLCRVPQQPATVSQANVCRDLLSNVLVECENALIGQDFYTHGRPRLEQSESASASAPKLGHHYFSVLDRKRNAAVASGPLSTALFARL